MDPLTLVLLVLVVAAIVAGVWLQRERLRIAAERDAALDGRSDDDAHLRFQAVAAEVLKSSNEEFLKLATERLSARETQAVSEMDKRRDAVDRMLGPIQQAIQKTHEELKQVGKDHAGLHEQVKRMSLTSQELRSETGKLAQALRKPNVRGRYGEIQLERVVELAGMRAYCDFTPQENLRDDDGKLQKPDLVVRLPNARVIAIDAKTSIDAYLDALDAKSPEEAEALMERYAENVMLQAQKLARKAYWTNFDSSPEFVVMFIPGDQLIDAAFERRPELIEYAAERNVVIASPSTLIGLLRAVHVGWREKNLTESASELFELGRELHKRAAIVLDHASKVGQAIDGARRHYNEFVGSVQGRLVPALRKFEEKDARSARDVTDLVPIEGEVREVQSLLPMEEADDTLTPAERPSAAEPAG